MSEGADWKDLLTAFDGSSITCGPGGQSMFCRQKAKLAAVIFDVVSKKKQS